MKKLTNVTMNLTERDIGNTAKLFNKFKFQTKADAVSAALSIAAALSDYFDEEGQEKEFYVLTKNEGTKKITISFGIHSI